MQIHLLQIQIFPFWSDILVLDSRLVTASKLSLRDTFNESRNSRCALSHSWIWEIILFANSYNPRICRIKFKLNYAIIIIFCSDGIDTKEIFVRKDLFDTLTNWLETLSEKTLLVSWGFVVHLRQVGCISTNRYTRQNNLCHISRNESILLAPRMGHLLYQPLAISWFFPLVFSVNVIYSVYSLNWYLTIYGKNLR